MEAEITLLELLTGNNPLRCIPAKNLLRRQIAHDFISSNQPHWIQDILRKATHPTPELRFQTMEAFGEAIATHYVPFLIDGDRIKAHKFAEKAMEQMFEYDRSAAHGKMSTRGLYVFKHDSELGNAHAHALFDRIRIARKADVDVARSFADYEVSIDEACLPPGDWRAGHGPGR